jgi:uncharacterized protein
MSYHGPTRREFMRGTLAGIAAVGIAPAVVAQPPVPGIMPTRPLGRTGVEVSILGLGGHHLGQIKDDQEAIAFARAAIDQGVTFMDNAWEYHDGRSEELMGRALQDGYREKAFLMTKHHGRDKATAMQHLEDSLRRLKTDVIDLWQFHEIVYDADPPMIYAAEGGIEAADQAKQEGKVRFIGFTGHKDPAIFEEMLKHEYPWDAVQLPINVLDAHFKSFRNTIVPILEERGIGVVAMKAMGSNFVLNAKVASPEECLNYAWSQPVATIVSGMATRDHLDANVALAKAFSPMSQDAQAQLLARSKEAAMTGRFEPFKTTRMFDGRVGRRLHGIG